MSDTGVQKAAILMLALGQDEAAEVMKFLEPREVQKLGSVMSTMKAISNDVLEDVLTDFLSVTQNSTSIGIGSDDYIRSVLTKALGDDKATSLLNRILISRDANGIESLKWMEARAVADLIRFEHPQIIATILVHLERLHASEILTALPEIVREETFLRIATLDGVQPAALNDLNEVLTKLLIGNENLKKKMIGGTKTTAEIMNFMGSNAESQLMSRLQAFDSNIAQQVLDQMFVFDDIKDIEDRDIQIILREIPSEGLIFALKGAKEEIKEKIFKNMSQRAAEMMREDLESKGPVRLSEVEKQQKEILQIVRRLADSGAITLGGGNDVLV